MAGSELSPIQLQGTTILLVDDSADNQRLFLRILEAAGARVELADNGLEAIEREQRTVYDLIIMDIHMPFVDGYQAARRIRQRGYRRPIVALTAHAFPEQERQCRDAGCSHFHLKPIDRGALLRAVSVALAESRAANTKSGITA